MPSQQNRLPSQKATVGSMATGARSATLPHARSEVVERIKKCLARANHATANENEAKSAIRMASKIMQHHNITQAQIMEGEDDAQRLERGGLSTVNIGPRTQYRKVIFDTWVVDLERAISTFFDCKAFSSQSFSSITWTFYGVAEHTVSAAMAFEMTHNLIQGWALPRHGVCARNSYCLGVAQGLTAIAKAEQRAVKRAAEENEAKSTATETQHERGDIPDNDSILADFNDEDSDMPDMTASFETELKRFAKAKSDPFKEEPTSKPRKVEWASSTQLTIYRQNVAKITEDVLKANNVKLYAGKKVKRSVKDQEQYAQGVKDSKKINVRGARIENGRA